MKELLYTYRNGIRYGVHAEGSHWTVKQDGRIIFRSGDSRKTFEVFAKITGLRNRLGRRIRI